MTTRSDTEHRCASGVYERRIRVLAALLYVLGVICAVPAAVLGVGDILMARDTFTSVAHRVPYGVIGAIGLMWLPLTIGCAFVPKVRLRTVMVAIIALMLVGVMWTCLELGTLLSEPSGSLLLGGHERSVGSR